MPVEAEAPGRALAAAGRPSRRLHPWWPWAALYLAAGAVIVALEHVWRGESYWLYSEGVYLATARLVLGGAALYTDVAAAQPPTIFYLGAGLLGVTDSLLFVRAALAVVTVVTGGLVAVVVARLTGRPAAAAGAGLVALITPWTLREHATLTPDPLAAAPLLGAALLGARPGSRSAAAGGVLAALAVSLKLAVLLPAGAVAVAVRRRGPYVGAAVAVAAALAATSFAIWGSTAWDHVVAAQGQTGFQLGSLPGLLAQTAWNLGPLLALAVPAYLARHRARDPALLRTLAALLLGSVALVVTFVKDGTYLNTLALIEPSAVALAATGLVWFLEDRSLLAARRRAAAVGAAIACALVAAQSASLVLVPETPIPFGNPFLSRAPGHELSRDEVRSAAETARDCPAGAPYSGSPFVAFTAGRRPPGNQPDRFIVGQADVHADLRGRVEDDGPLCPYSTLGGLPAGGAATGPLK